MLRRFHAGSPHIEPDTIELRYNGTDIAVFPREANQPARIAVCGDGGLAEIYDVETLVKQSTLLRTALPLRSIRISRDGEWCLLTGDDQCVAVNCRDITVTRTVPVGASAAKHAEFHPTNSSVVSVSTLDGMVRVYDLSDAIEPLIELDMIVPAIQQFSDDRSTAAKWSPQGGALAIPTKTFEVAIVSGHDWLVAARYVGHTNAITALEWSPNGRYLAACARDGRLLIFDAQTGGTVNDLELVDGCEIAWHPNNNELNVATLKGQMYMIHDAVPDSMLPPFGGEPFDTVATTKITKPTSSAAAGDEKLFLSEDDDLVVEDPVPAREYRSSSSSHRPRKRARLEAELPAQPPFQSGSTPWLNQRRYLCMSPVGYVWAVRQASTHHSVTISFFDQSARREVHFQDSDLFDLASLTDHACLFANSETGTISVRFHSSLADNWSTQIDTTTDGEISCIALSAEVVVIFTKFGYMRTYTLYGLPFSVVRAPSGVVCCAARENEVVYVYHSNGVYHYRFEDAATQHVYQKNDLLDFPPRTSLSALLFSEEGEPCVMDSAGTLATLLNSRKSGQARWVPILTSPAASAQGESEEAPRKRYWPIGVLEDKLLCVVLRGQRQYPAIPLPITDEINLNPPGVSETDGTYMVARTLFQQLQCRLELLADQGVEPDPEVAELLADQAIELDKMLLRRFQQACQDKRVNRALQIGQLIQGQESLQAAAQVAAAYDLTTLAERINEAID